MLVSALAPSMTVAYNLESALGLHLVLYSQLLAQQEWPDKECENNERDSHNNDDENDRHKNGTHRLRAWSLTGGKGIEMKVQKHSIGASSNYICTCNITPTQE